MRRPDSAQAGEPPLLVLAEPDVLATRYTYFDTDSGQSTSTNSDLANAFDLRKFLLKD